MLSIVARNFKGAFSDGAIVLDKDCGEGKLTQYSKKTKLIPA